MSRLTLTEKEHWKSRIENRINKAIEALSAQDTRLLPTIREKAEEMAHQTVGTAKLNTELQSVKAQIQSLEKQQESIERKLWAKVLGEQAVLARSEYSLKSDLQTLVAKHRDRHEQALLAKSKLGRKILKLRAEKEALLDTVWLATSSTQIRELWTRVSAVLGEEVTPLQQQILTDETNQD